MTDRTCSTGCGVAIGPRNESGLCRACRCRLLMARPEVAAKRSASVAVAVRRPEHRAKQSRNSRKIHADRRDDPSWQERLKAQGKALRQHDRYAANWRAGRQRSLEELHAWCPVERRDEYRVLRKKLSAAEAKALILADIAEAERKRIASLTPFQRQDEMIRRGRRVVPALQLRSADHAFSLTGGSLA